MGDRYYTFLPCPKCGKEYELYDAPSSLLYVGNCEHCGWKEPRDYYETDEYTIELMTDEQYAEWEKRTGRKALNMMTLEELAARPVSKKEEA